MSQITGASQAIASVLQVSGPVIAFAALFDLCQPAAAQQLANAAQSTPVSAGFPAAMEEIVVTARKRDEAMISTPVVMSAIGGEQLRTMAIDSLDEVSRIVPQLIIADSSQIQGGEVALRGIAGPDGNPFSDQAVSFNVDGVQVAKASVRRLAETDLAQIEVLKGPQALFFGKNSPAGIVSIRTNDPRDYFEAGGSVGYEVNADEVRSEAYVSSPITDDLGIRVAGFVSHMSGYLETPIPQGIYVASTTDRTAPRNDEYAFRGTLKYQPDDRFTARFKFNYFHIDQNGPDFNGEYVGCPYGQPQTGVVASCKASNMTLNYGSGPVIGTVDPIFENGRNFLRDTQLLTSLEMSYRLTDELLLTSVTGYYRDQAIDVSNYEDYNLVLPSANPYTDRSTSEEIRLQSSFSGPLNFTLGTNLSWTHAFTASPTYFFASDDAGEAILNAQGLGFIPLLTPFQAQNYALAQNGEAYSVFGQLAYFPISTVEVDVGGRYSYERKTLPLVQNEPFGFGNPFGNNPLTSVSNVPATPDAPESGVWHDFSPEVTLSYRPTNKFTVFASYKQGFLSGGFDSGGTSFTASLRYDPMIVRGFEVGIKGLLFDDTLRFDLAGYGYNVSGLQVTNFVNNISYIRNAAGAEARGAEVDFTYRPPVEGLSLHGAVSYNRAVYSAFPNAPCYNGQTNAMGCFLDPSGNAVQSLAGQRLPRAPTWSINSGADYEVPVGSDLRLHIAADLSYSSSYYTDISDNPYGLEPPYMLLDASVALGDVGDHWTASVIGRNLTDSYYWTASNNAAFSGSAAGGTTGVLGDVIGSVGRGREVMLRLSYRFESGE